MADTLLASATGRLRWPDDAVLFHLPPERELLTDKSTRLVFQTYLQLANLPFITQCAINADHMSPSGSAPFLLLKFHSNSLIFCEFEKLTSFLDSQQLGLAPSMKHSDRCNMEAYISLMRSKIIPAEEYQMWVNSENFKEFSLKTHGFGLPWPLHLIVPHLQKLRYNWNHWDTFRKPQSEILREFEQAYKALSDKLGSKEMFFEDGPTALDAMVYGHMQAVMNTELPKNELLRVVMQFKNLREYCEVTMPAKGLTLDTDTAQNVEENTNY